jgi:putative glutamine amidotransferase
MKLTIGLSYAPQSNPKYLNYTNAVIAAAKAQEHDVDVVDLHADPDRFDTIDGIIFTGGEDVAPERYGKPEERPKCTEISEERDEHELRLAERAEEAYLPTLGICRGLQLLNVYHGGTLITDIASSGGPDHTKLDPATDRRHQVAVVPNSTIAKILRAREGEINSAHHQAIERPGAGLSIAARSDDGTPEAIEWADPNGKPFFLGVQWHPERMGFDEPFAGQLFETFIWEVAAHKLLKHRIAQTGEKRPEG